MAKLNPNISRRGFVRLALAGAGAAAFASAFSRDPEAAYAAEAASNAAPYANTVKIAILSDIHYMSHTLFAENDAFHSAENSDRKLFRQSKDILTKALQDVRAYKPNAIFVSGDLTKDGEQVCHKEVRDALLGAASESADGCIVRVINGNHDINNNEDGRDFTNVDPATGEAAKAGAVTPSQFRSDEYYGKCGYDDADELYVNSAYYPQPDAGHDSTAGAVSYVTHFAGTDGTKVTLICVDSCRYSYDTTDTTNDEHETHGRITGVPKDADGNAVFDPSQLGSTGLLPWVLKKAQDAKNQGDVVFVMQHHGIVAHFGQEPTILADYLVEDYDVVAKYYAWAGISCVLTGHMHANDVAAHQFPEFADTGTYPTAVPAIYDIETCATVTYPSDIRYLTLNFGKDADGATGATLAFASHRLGRIKYTLTKPDGSLADWDDAGTPAQGEIADITEFGHERLLTLALLQNIITVYGGKALEYIEATDGPHFIESLKIPGGGIKPLLASMLGKTLAPDDPDGITADTLNAALFQFLAKFLADAGHVSEESGYKVAIPSSYQALLGAAISIWFDASTSIINLKSTDSAANAAMTLAQSEPMDRMVEAAQTEAVSLSGGVMPADARASLGSVQATISATGDVSLDTFLNSVFGDIDKLLKDETQGKNLLSALQRVATDACNAKIPANPAKTLLDTINFAYADHLKGDEQRDEWVQQAFDAMSNNTGVDAEGNKVENDGSLISFVREAVDGTAEDAGQAKAADIMALLALIGTDVTKLANIKATALGFIDISGTVKSQLQEKFGTADKLVSTMAGSGNTPGMAIPDIPALRTFVMPILYTLTEDDNTAKPGDDAESGVEPDAKLVDPSAGLDAQGDHHFGFTVGTGALVGSVTITGDGVADGAVKLQVGKTLKLTATYESNAAQTYAAYEGKWSSDNEAVATVNAQTGEVTGVAAGTANVSAMINGATSSVAVNVVAAAVAVPAPLFNVDFRRRSAKDWASGHTLNRSHYSGGTRMDKKLRQPVAMMDGKGGLGYDLTADDYKKMIDNGFTMELLFRVPSTPDGYHSLFDNVQDDGMGLYLNGSTLTFEVKEGTSSSKTVTVANIQPSTWYHVVAVNDNVSSAPSMSITLNGGDKTTNPSAQAVGSQETSYTIYIGAETSMNNGAPEFPAVRNTAIAFARIYGRPLTDDEAAQLYQKSGLAGK